MDDKEKKIYSENYYGDERLRPHVVFRRNTHMYCIYCGGIATTREHCPSKTFLKKPRPTNLPVLPACVSCNNGFSKDEMYVKEFLEIIKAYYEKKDIKRGEIFENDRSEIKMAKRSSEDFIKQPMKNFDDKFGRILTKLAIGHAVYELSEGYYSEDSWDGTPLYVKYGFKYFMSKEEWENLEVAEVISDEPLPEIGSRVFRNIYVVTPILQNIETGEQIQKHFVMLDWTDVQEGNYSYIAYKINSQIMVRMKIMDCLYAEVVFEEIS